jgi:hypothetical protein
LDQPPPTPEPDAPESDTPESDTPEPDVPEFDTAEPSAEAVATGPDVAARPPRRSPRVRRRATTPPPDGTDPTPAPEPPRHPRNENDDRMRADKPPHY